MRRICQLNGPHAQYLFHLSSGVDCPDSDTAPNRRQVPQPCHNRLRDTAKRARYRVLSREKDLEEIFENLTENYGLVAVFLSLVTTPLGNPIPEDASLFVAGMLARSDQVNIITALVVGYLGVTLGDCIAWSFGRRVGLHPTGFIARLIGPKALKRVEGLYLSLIHI